VVLPVLGLSCTECGSSGLQFIQHLFHVPCGIVILALQPSSCKATREGLVTCTVILDIRILYSPVSQTVSSLVKFW
jgi:hypothetical protein